MSRALCHRPSRRPHPRNALTSPSATSAIPAPNPGLFAAVVVVVGVGVGVGVVVVAVLAAVVSAFPLLAAAVATTSNPFEKSGDGHVSVRPSGPVDAGDGFVVVGR